jgi:hypothetical protein
MKYIFYCECPNFPRFAFSKHYKSLTWLHKKIAGLEANGWRVEVVKSNGWCPIAIYESGKGILNSDYQLSINL